MILLPCAESSFFVWSTLSSSKRTTVALEVSVDFSPSPYESTVFVQVLPEVDCAQFPVINQFHAYLKHRSDARSFKTWYVCEMSAAWQAHFVLF